MALRNNHNYGNAPPNKRTQSSSSTGRGEQQLEWIKAISDRLETGLNEAALLAISDLLRAGVHPDAVVAVVTSLHQQA
jgi:hypothetical protein